MNKELRRLARLYDVCTYYLSSEGKPVRATNAQIREHLLERGVACGTKAEIRKSTIEREYERIARRTPPVFGALPGEDVKCEIRFPKVAPITSFSATFLGQTVQGSVETKLRETTLADGSVYEHFEILLPAVSEIGLHYVDFTLLDTVNGELIRERSRVIISPKRFYQPPNEEEVVVVMSMLSSVVSKAETYFGRGNYADLESAVEQVYECGGQLFAPGPLFMFGWRMDLPSGTPFMSASRMLLAHHCLNVLGLSERLGLRKCENILRRTTRPYTYEAPGLQPEMDLVSYDRFLMTTLEEMWCEFSQVHSSQNTEHERAFLTFVERKRPKIHQAVLYMALLDHFFPTGSCSNMWNWRNWPEEFKDPNSEAVKEFERTHQTELMFIYFVQWLVQLDLHSLKAKLAQLGPGAGIMGNLPIGLAEAAAETWYAQSRYMDRICNGVPGDRLARKGQSWAYPMPDPWVILNELLEPFTDPIEEMAEYCLAFEIDHGPFFEKMFAYLANQSAASGVYVRFPLELLLWALAALSHQYQFFVCPELVGTKSGKIDKIMERWGAYRIAQQRFESGKIPPKSFYLGNTHNHFPELAYAFGLDLRYSWQYRDPATLEEKQQAYADRELELAEQFRMLHERELVSEAVIQEFNALRAQYPEASAEILWEIKDLPAVEAMCQAWNLSRKHSLAQVRGIDAGEALKDPLTLNMPGVSEGYPSWLRRLPVAVEDWARSSLGDRIREMAS